MRFVVTLMINWRDVAQPERGSQFPFGWSVVVAIQAYPKWVNRRRKRAHCQGQ